MKIYRDEFLPILRSALVMDKIVFFRDLLIKKKIQAATSEFALRPPVVQIFAASPDQALKHAIDLSYSGLCGGRVLDAFIFTI